MTRYRKIPEPYSSYAGGASRIIQRYLAAAGVPDWSRVLLSWQREDGSWTISDEQAESVHAAGSAIMWVGLAGVSRISSSAGSQEVGGGSAPVAPKTISVPAEAVPYRTDAPGTTNDKVTLTAVEGVQWAVGPAGNQTVYGYAAFAGKATMQVPWTGGGTVEVSGVPEPGYVLNGTSAWVLTFTDDTQTTTTTVSVPAGSVPVGDDQPGTANDKVTLTPVEGVQWVVNGANIPDGTTSVPVTTGAAATVSAVAKTGYAVTGTTTWTVPFTDAAASPWTLTREVTYPTDVTGVTSYTAPDGTVLTASTGTITTVGGRLTFSAGTGGAVNVDEAETGTKWAIELTVHGRPEEFNHNSAQASRTDFWNSDPVGWAFEGATAAFTESANLGRVGAYTGLVSVPLTTGENVLRMEVDTVGKTAKVFGNGVLAGTAALAKKLSTAPSFGIWFSEHNKRGATYGPIRFYTAAA